MVFFFFKQKTAYEIKECDWSSDVCSSDLDILISISNKDSNPLPEQNYVISEPNTMICEENEDTGFEFWIRDWPY